VGRIVAAYDAFDATQPAASHHRDSRPRGTNR
jgi:phosphate starvation-inducible protein PhoH and related proteins